jgi:hypothetical protein
MFVLLLFTLWEPVDPPAQPYTAELTFSQDNPLSLKADRIEIIDPSGHVLWSRNVDAPAASFPLAEGAALLAVEQAPEGAMVELQFIDPHGQLLSTNHVENFAGPIEISDNREAALVRCASKTVLFTRKGEIIASYPGSFSHLSIDASGSRVALASSERISIYSGQDELASIELGNPYVRDMVFSTSGTRLAALTSTSVVLWHQGEGKQVLDLSSYDTSPKTLCFDSDEERVLVIMRDSVQYQLLTVDLKDLRVITNTQPLGSPDETVIEIKVCSQGWLVHLTPGWFRFSQGER